MVIGLWINQDIAINKWKVSDITITSLKKLENIFRRNNDNKRATGKRNGTRGNQGTGGKQH